jgi:hypothetical protein
MANLRLEADTEDEVNELLDEVRTVLVVRDVLVQRGRKGTPPKWLGYANVQIMEPGERATPVRPAVARAAAEPSGRASAPRPDRVTSPRRRAAR